MSSPNLSENISSPGTASPTIKPEMREVVLQAVARGQIVSMDENGRIGMANPTYYQVASKDAEDDKRGKKDKKKFMGLSVPRRQEFSKPGKMISAKVTFPGGVDVIIPPPWLTDSRKKALNASRKIVQRLRDQPKDVAYKKFEDQVSAYNAFLKLNYEEKDYETQLIHQMNARKSNSPMSFQGFVSGGIQDSKSIGDKFSKKIQALFEACNCLDVFKEVEAGNLAVSGSTILRLLDNYPKRSHEDVLSKSDIDIYPVGSGVTKEQLEEWGFADVYDEYNEQEGRFSLAERKINAEASCPELLPCKLQYIDKDIFKSLEDYSYSFLCNLYTMKTLVITNPYSLITKMSVDKDWKNTNPAHRFKYQARGYTLIPRNQAAGMQESGSSTESVLEAYLRSSMPAPSDLHPSDKYWYSGPGGMGSNGPAGIFVSTNARERLMFPVEVKLDYVTKRQLTRDAARDLE